MASNNKNVIINKAGFIVDDRYVEVYEPYGSFSFSKGNHIFYVLYGHEEIVVTDEYGNEIIREHTR